jgi:hypothetical protein
MANQIEIEIKLEDGSVKKAFIDIEAGAKKTGDAVEKNVGGAFEFIKKHLIGIAAAVGSFHAIKAVLHESVTAAMNNEAAINSLVQSMRNSGIANEEAKNRFLELGEAIQKTTTIDDDMVYSMGKLAYNFARSSEQAEKMTKAAIELSAATGVSLEGAVQQLGMTLEGNIGRLGRTVPALRGVSESSLRAGAALDIVMQRFAGSEAAKMNTFAGALANTGNKFEDIWKALGSLITNSPALTAAIKVFGDLFGKMADSIKEFGKSGDVVGTVLIYVVKFAEAVNTFMIAPLELLYNVANAVFSFIIELVYSVINGFVEIGGLIADLADMAGISAGGLIQTLQNMRNLSREVFSELEADTTNAANNVLNFDVSGKSAIFLEDLRRTMENAQKITVPAMKKIGQELDSTWTTLWTNMKKTVNDAIAGGISKGMQLLVTNLAKGKGAFDNFGKELLNMAGDLAIKLGEMLVGQAIALWAIGEAMKNPITAAPAALAWGLALIAIGAALKAFGSGGGEETAPSTSAASISGASPSSGSLSEQQSTSDMLQHKESAVTVHVHGNVFDRRETGLEIANIIKEAVREQGVSLA